MIKNYDPTRRIVAALYKDKGTVFRSPFPGSPDYVVVGRGFIVYNDCYKKAWQEWAKHVRLNQYDFLGVPTHEL